MHITLETDYAIRIVDALARSNQRMGAKSISDMTSVTLRFSLKILRKLVASGVIRSYKGAQGGYEIARPLEDITLNDIICTIEGPYRLSRCLSEDASCTRGTCKRCPYHESFRNISELVTEQLTAINMADMIKHDIDTSVGALSCK